jgi:hypothetical protein
MKEEKPAASTFRLLLRLEFGRNAEHDPEPGASIESHSEWLKSTINQQGNLT